MLKRSLMMTIVACLLAVMTTDLQAQTRWPQGRNQRSRQSGSYYPDPYLDRGNSRNNPQDTAGKAVARTIIGAGIGAGTGAIIGGRRGALIGATAGAVGGLIYHEVKVRRQTERRRRW